MKYKKVLSLSMVTIMAASLAMTGCGKTETESQAVNSANFSDTTITGTVEEIDGQTVTLSLSTGNASMEMPGDMGGQGAPTAPTDGAAGTDQAADQTGETDEAATDSQTPPEKPDGDSSGDSATDAESADAASADGAAADSQTPPEKPDGDSSGDSATDAGSADAASADGAAANGQTPPEKPDGDSSSDSAAAEGNAAGNADGEGADNAVDSTESEETAEVPASADQNSAADDGQSSDTDSADSDITVELDIEDASVLQDESGESVEYSQIEVGDTLEVTFDEEGGITLIVWSEEEESTDSAAGQMGAMGGQSSDNSNITYTAVNEYTEDTDLSDETVESTGTDENAILVSNGSTVKLDGVTINRTSSDSTGGDNSSFYGVGAALLTTDGTTYISNSDITTDAAGGAGVFAYGDGTTYVSDTTINTTQNTSGGIHVAGGGSLYAWNVTATTQGESAAAIRSDRGGGTMVIDGGSYTSNGVGSPAVYCTADITVNDATLTANGSEAVCIEGLNTLRLFDCDLTGTMSDDSQNDCTWNVIVYQSMSGDSEVGNGTFSMSGGTLTANNGGIFYTTNTDSTFYLNNVDITYADENDFFLRCTGNANQRGWGSTGSNGANCSFTADDQDMVGDIVYDSISNLDLYMENGSTLTGAFVDDESCAGNGGSGAASLYISSDSTWTVTADSTLTNLYNEGSIVDENGKTVTIVGTDGTVYVQGTSDVTVTVDSYSETADFSGATEGDSFSDYQVENPF